MIAKRLGAIALTVAMIVGAWLIRSQVIDDDGGVSGDDEPPPTAREIVCVSDLHDACEALADERGLAIRIEVAATTLEEIAALEDPSDAPIWITMAPFPEMVDSLRVIRGAPALEPEQSVVASSPVALVVPIDRGGVLAEACGGEPLDWVCVGAAAGDPWEEIGGDPLWGDVRPAFAPIDSAIGLLGVGEAVSGYFGGSPIQPNDPDFLSWARRLAHAVSARALSGRTAIETIETRPSALDVAVGAAAEFSGTGVVDLSLQYADPMIRADVVVAVPEGASLPSGLSEDLGRLLLERRWLSPSAEQNPLPTAVELLAIRTAWKEALP